MLTRFLIFYWLLFASCQQVSYSTADTLPKAVPELRLRNSDSVKTIHVLVALCDNKYQGIVPVPAGIGNGQQPATNLYWGAGYGVAHFFRRKSSEWEWIKTIPSGTDTILERILFKHKSTNTYLLADAYDGRYIRQTTLDLLQMASGKKEVTVPVGQQSIYFGGASRLLAYVGHDGLMDFSIQENFSPADSLQRETIILACYSKRYFAPHLRQTGAQPILWSTHLMAPEAYVLEAAVNNWIKQKQPSAIAESAAQAYNTYQRCGIKAARKLLVSGW